MTDHRSVATTLFLFLIRSPFVSAWSAAPLQRSLGTRMAPLRMEAKDAAHTFDPLDLSVACGRSSPDRPAASSTALVALTSASCIAALLSPSAATAVTTAPNAVPSALAAYGHYLSMLLLTVAIMTERLLISPRMSVEDEKTCAFADIVTGVSGIGILASGYYRATACGKGWDFYSHEPIFWLKMTFMGIFGALSLFPTITIIRRSVEIQQTGEIEPMSEKLAGRLTTILNAELSALATIPLAATLMSRGVGYVDGFPTDIVGPVGFGAVTAGAVFKYAKD